MNGIYCLPGRKSSYVRRVSEAWCRLVLLTVCLTLSSGLFAQDSGSGECDRESLRVTAGSGIEDDPYQICNIHQLQNITTLTASYELTQNIDARETEEGTGFDGGAGFDPVSGFSPIGSIFDPHVRVRIGSSPFTGTFDGGSHRISNLRISRFSNHDVGLFCSLSDAVVRDLGFSEVYVLGNARVGIIAGHAGGADSEGVGSEISGITVMNSVVEGRRVVGILVGSAAGNSKISSVTVTDSVVTGRAEKVGGIIGELAGSEVSTVRVAASAVMGEFQVGGVVGYQLGGHISAARVTDSTITVTVKDGGGVVGYINGGIIQGSEAIGILVKGVTLAHSHLIPVAFLGGLVGYLAKGGVVRQSYATGVVGNKEIDHALGGLVGSVRLGARVEDSYAWGGVAGRGPVGGLAGINLGTIRNTYAYSVVTPRDPGQLDGIGIFVGVNGQGVIEGSYAAGTVSGSTPASLVGYPLADARSGTSTESSIRTLSQLRRPTTPSTSPAETFYDWDPDIWYFGSANTLPVLKGLTRIPATPTDASLEWSSTNSLVLRSASTPNADYFELELKVGESSAVVLLARSPNFELGDLSQELRENFAGGATVVYTVRVSSETRVVSPPGSGGGEETWIVSPPFPGSFRLLDVPGAPTSVTASDVTDGSAATRKVRVTVSAPDNDGYGRSKTNTAYGSKVNGVDLDLAYVVSALDVNDNSVSSMTVTTTETPVIIDLDGLSAGTQYRIVTFTQNAVGAGGELSSEDFKTLPGGADAPIVVSVRETPQNLVLSWAAPHHGGSTIRAYVVTVGGDTEAESTTRLDSSSMMYVVDPTTLRRVFPGGDEITYSVRAVNAFGDGSESTGKFTLLDVPGSLTVTQVRVTTGVTTVQVTVSAPDNDGYGRKATDTAYGSEADGVELEFAYVVSVIGSRDISVSSMTKTTTATSLTLVLGGLEPGTQYKLEAFVQNAVGAGGPHDREFMTGSTSPADRVRLRLRAYLGGAVR